MKFTLRLANTAVLAGILVATYPGQALAQITLSSTVPGAKTVVLIQPNKQSSATGIVKFKFSAPTAGAYSLGFCIGPAANPCGMATSYVVQVPGGQERLAVVDASFFTANVLVVNNPTSTALPFAVAIE